MKENDKRVAALLRKAERDLRFAHYALDFQPEQAGRMAYMTAFHAAQAAVLFATGTEPRTHTGLRTMFGQLTVKEPLLGSELGAFLARSYESKDIADYRTEYEVDRASGETVVEGAVQFLERIRSFLDTKA